MGDGHKNRSLEYEASLHVGELENIRERISRAKFSFVEVQVARWDKGGNEKRMLWHFLYE
jgi:hypothetical protein